MQTLQVIRSGASCEVDLHANGPMAVNALYAALFEPCITRLHLSGLPASQIEGPDYLGILKLTDIPEIREAVSAEAAISLER